MLKPSTDAGFYNTLVPTYKTKQCHIPQEHVIILDCYPKFVIDIQFSIHRIYDSTLEWQENRIQTSTFSPLPTTNTQSLKLPDVLKCAKRALISFFPSCHFVSAETIIRQNNQKVFFQDIHVEEYGYTYKEELSPIIT
jgi:hypothetical protein